MNISEIIILLFLNYLSILTEFFIYKKFILPICFYHNSALVGWSNLIIIKKIQTKRSIKK